MMAGRMRGNAAISQWLELLCCLKNAIMEWPGRPWIRQRFGCLCVPAAYSRGPAGRNIFN